MVLTVDVVDSEAADHVHLPMSKVQHIHDAEDQSDPERDQRIGRGENHRIEYDLPHN
jgi:hypothetical protein